MPNYAKNTSVSVSQSQIEIQSILRRYGADRFGSMEDKNNAYLMFEYNGLLIQIQVPMPKRDEFITTPTGRKRTESQINREYDKAVRQKWRALVLAVKAKLEAIESGISTLEKEFLAFVVMPDGNQLGDHVIPNLKQIAETGKMPKMLTAAVGSG